MAQEIPSFQLAGYTSMPAAARQYQNFERIFQWRDDLSKVVGSHNLKFGTLIMRSRKNQDSVPNINGLFVFQTGHSLSSGNAVADAVLGNFYQYEEADIGQQGWFRFTQAEFYAQDNWKVSRRLSLDLGFRYEYIQPWYSALQNLVSFAPQYYNPANAVSLVPSTGAFVPGSGNPYNGIVLGGSSFPAAAQARIPNYNDPAVQALFHGLPKETTRTDYATPGPRVGFAYDLTGHERTVLRGGVGMFYERVNGITAIGRIAEPPFIKQVDIYSGNVESPAGGSNIQYASALTSGALDLRAPRVANWSLGIQHKLTENMILDAAYVGSGGWNLYRTINLNQLQPGTVQKNPGVNINALRPYLGYGNITQYITGSNSNYNALQVSWKDRIKGGGIFNVSYTWSRAIDNASAFNTLAMNSFNFRLDRGPSDYNRTQIFVLSYVYPLPFWRSGHLWYQKAIGGWQLAGVTSIETGLPLNLVLPSDTAGTGASGERPNVVGDPQAGNIKSALRWFNTAAFAVPTAGTYGNLGRNAIAGPGMNNWDASLQKIFALREKLQMQLRWEVYNAPQHFSFWSVGTTVNAGNFGQVTGATDPRTMQLGVRLEF